jgi:hypothetical protein
MMKKKKKKMKMKMKMKMKRREEERRGEKRKVQKIAIYVLLGPHIATRHEWPRPNRA